MRLAACLAVSVVLVGNAPGASGSTVIAPAVDAEASSASWSALGEYRVSPRPTSLSNRSREPIVTAHPFDASRLAVVYAAGPGEQSHPVSGSATTGARRGARRRPPAGRRQPPDGRLGPGPTRGSARLCYTAMVGPETNYHFGVSYSDNEGATWHLGFIADNTRGWSSAWRTWSSTPTPPARTSARSTSPTTGRRTPTAATGCTSSRRATSGAPAPRRRSRRCPRPAGYGDAWRIGYKLTTAPDGSAYVAGYQLDMKHWQHRPPVLQGRHANVGRIAFGVARLRFDRGAAADARRERPRDDAARDLVEPRLHAALKGVNVGLAEPCWATGLVVDASGRIYYAVAGDGRIRIVYER